MRVGYCLIHLNRDVTVAVDLEDLDLLVPFRWRLLTGRGRKYAVARGRLSGKIITVYMHRLILKPKQGFVVDHIDGNGLNNRRSNLRICTPAQNRLNARHEGARQIAGRWYPYLGTTTTGAGGFSTKEEAMAAYQEAHARLYGEFSPWK
jgi:hypothetical protein